MLGKPKFYFIVGILSLAISILAFLVPHAVIKHNLSPALYLNNVHDRVITGLNITGHTADCITLSNCYNITISNCKLGFSTKNGISIFNCRNIKVVNCYFEKLATGVYALSSKEISVNYNQFKNMQGPFPRGQMVQFDNLSGPGNQINYNKGENLPGQSDPQDAINIYKTYGTAASPVQVIGNRIRGGGPSKAGGGIMLGDYGGAYIVAKGNILVNPGQYGMAIAGGNNISIVNNIIYGRRQPFTNVGIYIWNQHATGCTFNTIAYNKVRWTNGKGENNPAWNQGNCSETVGWETNILNAKLEASILPKKLIDK